jgi:hypothetical protein
MSTARSVYGDGVEQIRQVFYTGKTIHATDGSRVAAQVDIQEGDILTMDPFDHENKGLGVTVGNVLNAATYIGLKSFLVKSFHPDVNKVINSTTGQRQGGMVDVVSIGAGSLAYTKANMTAGVTGLCLKESSGVTVKPHLEATAAPTTVAIAAKTQGMALETHDSSTTAAYKRVNWGGYAGNAAA